MADAVPGSLAAACEHVDAAAELAANRDILSRHEELAEQLAAAGAAEDAVAVIAGGAQLAVLRHPGALVSARMERVLAGLGAAHLAPIAPRERPESPSTVLHVATELYPVGGHSRVLWRWLDRDPGRTHSVVLTAQRGALPEGVAAAVAATGGRIDGLDPAAPALERAAVLRERAAAADVIVVHAHPFDPLPVLALAGAADRPPVVFFNHGDHLFWLGRAIADVVQCSRPVGASIAVAGRGVDRDRALVLPFPVTGADGQAHDPARRVDREQRAVARRMLLERLGWPQDTVLLFTAGSAYKYDGPAGVTLLDLVEPVLAAHPHARLLAAGAEQRGAWAAAAERHPGRIAAVGALPRITSLFTAADIYLESRPFGGPGASAEGASFGLPVLTTAATPEEAELFTTQRDYGAQLALGAGAYRAELGRLIADPAHRAAAGERSRRAIAAADAGWGSGVERAYRSAAALGPVDPWASAELPAGPRVRDALVLFEHTATGRGADDALVARILSARELAAGDPVIRALYGSLGPGGGPPELLRRYAAAFAAPERVDEHALAAVVAAYRRLAVAGVVSTLAVAVRPEDADVAVGVLGPIAEAEPGLLLDLVIDLDPAATSPPSSLTLLPPGSAPRRHAHVC